jgi:nucleoside-diphosphate-sugar epimerase
MYYDCNIGGTVNLLKELGTRDVKRFVFSSSATVYGEPEMLPLREEARLMATNPYGRTKLFVEEILRDCHASDSTWNVLILRYFNPIGTFFGVMLYSRGSNSYKRPTDRADDFELIAFNRCSSIRKDWRGPPGYSQQPHAIYCTSLCWA